jgi:hypothetical protein
MAFSQSSSNAHGNAAPPATPNGTSDATAPGGRHPRRILYISLLLTLVCIVGAAALLRMFAAQRIPELTAADLEAAQKRWDRAGPESYEMDLEILRERPGTVHIEVRNSEIAAMTRDGLAPKQHTWRYWSVPGRFEELERELEIAEDPVHEIGAAAGTRWKLRCEFDPAYGFPRKYHRYASGGGPEVYWRVTSFVPK